MEEHLRSQESLIANIDLSSQSSSSTFVSIFPELVRLDNFSTFILSLRVILLKLLDNILANVPVALLDLLSNIH